MSFKTAKIAAVIAAQLCWLVLTYTVFGGFGDATKTVSWMVMVAMVLLLPLTLCQQKFGCMKIYSQRKVQMMCRKGKISPLT